MPVQTNADEPLPNGEPGAISKPPKIVNPNAPLQPGSQQPSMLEDVPPRPPTPVEPVPMRPGHAAQPMP